MDMIEKFASYGLIHSDFNEFNLLIDKNSKIYVIDFPQMVSISHKDADFFLQRDVDCINTLFERKFNFIGSRNPKISEIKIIERKDVTLKASGYLNYLEQQEAEQQKIKL